MSAFHEIALAGEANNQPKSTIIIDSFAFTDLEVIYQTRETVSHRYIKTPTRTFKIRHTAEYFWRNSRCLNSRWNIVSNVGWIFSIEVNKEIKSSKSMLNETMYLFCVDELWMRLRKTVHTIQLLRFLDLPSSAPEHQLCCQCKPSTPPAFRFFICGRLPLCLCVTGPTSVSSASQATLTASVTVGAGLFRTSEKCFFHFFFISSFQC